MKLPNGDKAIIDDKKFWAYVLNPRHPHGREHARLFKHLLDIDLSNWQLLRSELERAAREEEATPGRSSSFGTKYEIRSSMTGTRGQHIILSVWIVPTGETIPRLVTTYIE